MGECVGVHMWVCVHVLGYLTLTMMILSPSSWHNSVWRVGGSHDHVSTHTPPPESLGMRLGDNATHLKVISKDIHQG